MEVVYSDKMKEVLGTKIDNSYARLNFYGVYGLTEEAKSDPNWFIRFEAYFKFGYTEEARNDPHSLIRLNACRVLGFTEDQLADGDDIIRHEAIHYFGLVLGSDKAQLAVKEAARKRFDRILKLSDEVRY